jgi:hypothetical protein
MEFGHNLLAGFFDVAESKICWAVEVRNISLPLSNELVEDGRRKRQL